jgi:hypothetical protein
MHKLKELIDLLNSNDFLIGDEDIDIAKGKYKRPESWKEFRNILKRK